MKYTNAQLLAALNGKDFATIAAAFKGIIEVGDLGDSVLQPEKATAFVRTMELSTRILPQARFKKMLAKRVEIDRIGISGRVLRSGKNAAGQHRSLNASEYASIETAVHDLLANELIAIISMRDDTLRENIEEGRLEATVLDLFGSAAGRDFEEYALFADTNIPYAEDDVLSKTDGWCAKAENKLYGRTVAAHVARDFDGSAVLTDPEPLFELLITSMPAVYMDDPSGMKIFVDWETQNAYANVLRERGSALGDRAQLQNGAIPFKGFNIEAIPLFARAATVDTTNDTITARDRVEGRVAMLQIPSNMVWGVWHQVEIEPEREAKERRTDFVLTFEGDAGYEDENAVVIAFLDKANPAAA